ncbi:MAG: G5 domain-containing protein [Anaerolineaceae bacterium]|nr:G5 domain-containing protein [Anaerolineaceae bacterium]
MLKLILNFSKKRLWSAMFCLAFFVAAIVSISGCASSTSSSEPFVITILVDGDEVIIESLTEVTIQTVLETAGITLNHLDRIEPSIQTLVDKTCTITITRIHEEFEIVETVIPFETQTVRNESLPEGQTLLVQSGINGIMQTTHRILYENGIETSRTTFDNETIMEAKPEIVMVGIQTPYTEIPIAGKFAYITSGNAWVMEGTTGKRYPIVTTGDLDGRIFSLSPDGNWLLYTRQGNTDEEPDIINTLWVINFSKEDSKPIYLRVDNIVHFAEWNPIKQMTITYSTVESRSTAPGWQANNDLIYLSFNSSGVILEKTEILAPNSGGIYGWWGIDFEWSPDGIYLAYSRPDSVGLVDMDAGELIILLDIVPLQTRADWAWVPALGWSSDGKILFTVNHFSRSGFSNDEESPFFDLTAIVIKENGPVIRLFPQSGMFTFPSPSPTRIDDHNTIAFLKAIFPEQSDTSRYRMMLMDQDGSNIQELFPEEGSQGLEPQNIVWGPRTDSSPTLWIAIIFEGNLWLVNGSTNEAKQITGDGSISKISWH